MAGITQAKFGLVDYDWSNAKKTWANQSPMDADGMLVKQAARNKAANPSAKVFVYRNIVKALVRHVCWRLRWPGGISCLFVFLNRVR